MDDKRITRGTVLSRAEIDRIMGRNPRRWADWKRAGLKPLATGTVQEWYLTDELIAVWMKLRK